MFFNPTTNRWEKHPLCTCDRDPCVCFNLPPLDTDGKPISDYGVLGPNLGAGPRLRRELERRKKGAA